MSHRRVSSSRIELTIVLLLGVLGLAGGAAWSWSIASTAPVDADPAMYDEVIQPSPAFAPEDVVRMQLEALARFRDDPTAMLQCYSLASPANREVTGPLARFTTMIMNPDYRSLVLQEDMLIGKPIVRGDRAAVLATVLGDDRELSIYCFYLSRQGGKKYRDCWMTDSVIRVPPMAEPPTKGAVAKLPPESV